LIEPRLFGRFDCLLFALLLELFGFGSLALALFLGARQGGLLLLFFAQGRLALLFPESCLTLLLLVGEGCLAVLLFFG
jgi:hypothetical protein